MEQCVKPVEPFSTPSPPPSSRLFYHPDPHPDPPPHLHVHLPDARQRRLDLRRQRRQLLDRPPSERQRGRRVRLRRRPAAGVLSRRRGLRGRSGRRWSPSCSSARGEEGPDRGGVREEQRGNPPTHATTLSSNELHDAIVSRYNSASTYPPARNVDDDGDAADRRSRGRDQRRQQREGRRSARPLLVRPSRA